MISLGILDRSSSIPLHEQIAHGLRAAVLSGRVGGGDAVPSTRALAADLGVARGTVVAAYEILAGEGYLLAKPGGGTVVADVIAGVVPDLVADVVADVAAGMVPPAPGRTIAAATATETVPEAGVDLSPGRPRTEGVADAAWRSAWRRAAAVDPESDVDDPRGHPALRAEVARHLGRTRGLGVSPDDVMVTAGTSDAMLLTLVSLMSGSARGSLRVGIEDPGYPRVRMILQRLGIEAVPVPVRVTSGLDLDALEVQRDLDALIVTPNHHYPLGSRLDAEQRARLLAWAAREDVVVIEDDYDSEFPHGRAPLPPLSLLDPSRVVLIGSLSKVLSPAVRCGWLVASGLAGERVRATREDLDLPVSLVQQRALALYLAEGDLARHTARRRRDYRHRRGLLLEAFADVPGVELTATDGGLHAVVLLTGCEVATERAIVAEVAARGVRVEPLSRYAVSDASPQLPAGIVFGYAEPSTVVLLEAVDVMIAVLRARFAG
ncbi:transcriptional regulator containing a DNA-binding HTH domain and an aminotransferase domain (MocR family) and their eukaryotic orthologs [Microbacterium testaceum StLB037]|uniref:Transcriptional regulator containing a DNA-binding HTH domain and an aminotransferase domain (MocR family) and their eukaryotic orthologs n=1 Tax=Microbacterium testaceum (strain StLB037) TaxID=979556 RepID=E8NGQ1_MICTS|nr:PLP-dependent aminotransferase family protein [Microbacterium testaceum]BAJ75350.1 transcriptional regulator containing a DNA-binding HTH domain and an aminotransferase domain (MocR family) and their eukaryotic orthologs [Microbacterium testaceum StLB037]